MDLTISVNDTVTLSEVRFPVAYVVDAWNYADDQPIAYFSANASGIATSYHALSSTNYFCGQSFTGDGRYLGAAMFSVLLNPAPLPTTAKIYAKLYSHSGTYGVSSVPSSTTPLQTSTNYYTLGDITSLVKCDLVFYFDNTQLLANGTRYVIGIYSSEITTNSVIPYHYTYSSAYGASGNGSAISSTNVITSKTYDLVFAVHGPSFRVGHYGNVGSISVTNANAARSYSFSPDGLKVYYTADSAFKTRQYNLSTPFNLASGSYWGLGPAISSNQNVAFTIDGKNMYTTYSNVYIRHYTLSTPFDITTATLVTSKLVSSYSTVGTIRGVSISPNAEKIYITYYDGVATHIRQYNLSPAGALSSLTEVTGSGSYSTGTYNSPNTHQLYGGTGTNEAICQSYVPSSNENLGGVSTYGYDNGGLTDGIYVEVSTSLGGSVIATSTTGYMQEGAIGYFTSARLFFNGGVALTSGQEYFFTIKRSGSRSTSNYSVLGRSSSSTALYNGGKLYVRNSSVWTETTNSSLRLDLLKNSTTGGIIAADNGKFSPLPHVYSLAVGGTQTLGGRTSRYSISPPVFSPDGRIMAIQSGDDHLVGNGPETYSRINIFFFTLSTPWDITSTITSTKLITPPMRKPQYQYQAGGPIHISPSGKYIGFCDTTTTFDQFIVDGFEPTINETLAAQSGAITSYSDLGGVNVSSALTLSSLLTNSDFVEMYQVYDELPVTTTVTDSTASTGDISIVETVLSSEKIGSIDGSLVFNRGIYRVGGVPNYVSVKNKTGGTTGVAKTTRGGNMSNRSTLSGGTV